MQWFETSFAIGLKVSIA